MKILLDANFLRHLEQVNQLSLICRFADELRWEFILPKIVFEELQRKNIPNEIKSKLKDDTIILDSCNESQFSSIKSTLLGLDEGELEAICIIDKCEDRTFKNYLLLTDDTSAQSGAGKLGINSLDVIMTFLLANEKGLLSKTEAMESLYILENFGYKVNEIVKIDYLHRLK